LASPHAIRVGRFKERQRGRDFAATLQSGHSSNQLFEGINPVTPMDLSFHFALQDPLQCGEIAFYCVCVPLKRFVSHLGSPYQSKHEFTAVAIRYNPHGIVNDNSGFQFHIVIHDSAHLAVLEPDPGLPERGVDDPRFALLTNFGSGEARCP
jgi:hypothetical protein